MVDSYRDADIVRGMPSHSGHVVFKEAKLAASGKRIIYKLNKRSHPYLSLYEVALTNLLSLFVARDLTPRQTLVKGEDGEIVGLATEHFCYCVERRETLAPNFCSLSFSVENGFEIKPEKREKAEDIPIYFLNEFPRGFFAHLYEASQKGKFDLDIDSLASVLCGSYTLEEDDLHKGNLGFYVVEKEGRPKIVFFKIDNDLLMSESVMSYYDSRIVNWRHGGNAFRITPRDLLEFPKLQDSKNHYWPTSRRYLVNHSDPKVYSNSAEIESFIKLGKSKEFQQAKWRWWYKHILTQSTMIQECLARSLNAEDPYERAQIALITQASVARLSYLKATLFSLPEFRHYVSSVDHKSLIKEITGVVAPKHKSAINEQLLFFQGLCQPNGGFEEGDTPLHAAIRLGDYRYHETWEHFKEYANQTNDKNETPLDLAVKLAQVKVERGSELVKTEDPRRDPLFIMNHLLGEGVNKTDAYRTFRNEHKDLKITSYRFGTVYLNKTKAAKTAEDLIEVLRDLGEDFRFSLKMKKEISVYCVKYFLKDKEKNASLGYTLEQFKLALNGNHSKEPRPELQFIRQLRSTLWIIRVIRGLLGGTSTQVELNDVIDLTKKKIPQPPGSSYFSFFARQGSNHRKDVTAEQPDNSPQV
ncbi:Dot/Icm T4SS effector AnkK/LegA5 [Legionella brunensis]|uniref:Substrate of the Dot/Icm secretion system n=1 Tax=Legionella brunensis TaxID=29422 RepID=A0A0W0SEP8_9GAMM|nr:Dot/Icm T4SS effector AnkK/LegA5 [Legionella brunensis]KTC81659.1 substrate of the Dot/Icm secretion system [Legionella brunensis]